VTSGLDHNWVVMRHNNAPPRVYNIFLSFVFMFLIASAKLSDIAWA
jgi:hypothetical protein